ncbi:biotin/lipoyl-containing protein, partial [Paracoccus siganidrum]|uniref:biotin/lipoyl-containing protein n=1 Tax=Paracoccus siganidrum TaxID=1276757 RepID=UPI0031451BE1
MPDIGEGIAEAEIAEWLVAPGETVREDDPLVAVMTDKATVEIPSPVTGKLVWQAGQPGDVLAVGAELVRLEVDGAGNVAADASEVEAPPRDAPPEPAEEMPAEEKPAGKDPSEDAPPPAPPAPAPQAPPLPAAAAAPLRPAGEKPLAAPSVRA